MDFKLKPNDIANIFCKIIQSEDFDAAGDSNLPVYDRCEKCITKHIGYLYNKYSLYNDYKIQMYNEVPYHNDGRKKCDFVFANKHVDDINDKEDELWMEVKMYWDYNKTANNQENKIKEDIERLNILGKARKCFCLLVYSSKKQPNETLYKRIINELTKKIKNDKIVKSIEINANGYSHCHILLWLF